MKLVKSFFLFALIIFMASCSNSLKDSSQLNYTASSVDVIPIPNYVMKAEGVFEINENTTLLFDKDLSASALVFDNYISSALGYQLKRGSGFSFSDNTIVSFVKNDSISNEEGYKITTSEKGLLVEASSDRGAFFAVQTLRQLLPASFENSTFQNKSVKLDLYKIEDAPEYVYRGFMLDVARHFFTVDEVKRVIDILSIYKINTLHLHLSDDQGWRIEIKSWPNLTEHGSKSSVKNEKSGFYTQEDYKDIQDYAAKHQIVIIPEIDMPGHTNSALSSYAELNCNGKVTKPYYGTRVGFSTLCTDKDVVYKFIDDVIGELATITTGDYIHIGGDESHSTKLPDYIKFINKARAIVKSHGKKVIGWDEIAHSDIDEETIVQFWGKIKNAKLGADKGAKLIMSPADKIYLDIKYNDSTKLGLTWAGLNSVKDSYTWKADSFIDGVNRDNILGVEAPLWSETIVTSSDLQFLLLPRLLGVAEQAWSKPENMNWETYKLRLAKQEKRFDALNVNFYKTPQVIWEKK